MIKNLAVKVLLRLDRLIEKLQNSLQNIRLRVFDLTWDMIEKERKALR